jgi:hypothetical protein
MNRYLIGLLASAALLHAADAPACDPNNGGITLPSGFCAFIAADGLGEARHLAVAANGDVYVAIQGGGVTALRDANGDGRFEMKEHFGDERHRCCAPQRLCVRRDS